MLRVVEKATESNTRYQKYYMRQKLLTGISPYSVLRQGHENSENLRVEHWCLDLVGRNVLHDIVEHLSELGVPLGCKGIHTQGALSYHIRSCPRGVCALAHLGIKS